MTTAIAGYSLVEGFGFIGSWATFAMVVFICSVFRRCVTRAGTQRRFATGAALTGMLFTLLTSVFVISETYSASAEQTSGATRATRQSASDADSSQPSRPEPGWREYASAEHSFSILMPDDPSEESRTLSAANVEVHFFNASQGETSYMVACAEFPESLRGGRSNAEILDDARDGAVGAVRGTLLSERLTSLNGHPGREISVADQFGTMRIQSRIFLVENRLFQIAVIAPVRDLDSAAAETFLDSFTVTIDAMAESRE